MMSNIGYISCTRKPTQPLHYTAIGFKTFSRGETPAFEGGRFAAREGVGREGKAKGGEGKGKGGDVEGPGKWSAPGPALALGGPVFRNMSADKM